MKNYFNYFTEIEEHFVRKRGKNLLVSPLDWCLIELWRDEGIPLHVVLRGIERSFDSAERQQKKTPRSLFYCHPAIIEAYDEYRQAMVGAAHEPDDREGAPGHGRLDRDTVQHHLHRLQEELKAHSGEGFDRCRQRLEALRLEVASRSQVHLEQLDRELGEISSLLAESLKGEMEAEQVKALQKEVRQEMKIYRKRLSKEMYQRLETSYLTRKILAGHGLPEFSLLELL